MADFYMLPIDRLHPHPDNPRKDVGDVTELAESIKVNGILQNLTVVTDDPTSSITTFTVIIGHRRLAAAQLAGLDVVPCVIAEMSPEEQIETMLTENMQRTDLTVYEQANGFQMMLDLGNSVEEIAQKSGFSETTVRRRVKMMELDQDKLKEVSSRQLSLSDFDKLAQIDDIEARNNCLAKIGTSDFNQAVASQIRKQKIKENLPRVKEFLAGIKAKEIKSGDQYSSKYESVGPQISIEKDSEVENLSVPKDIKGTVYYYLEESWGSLRFYREHKKAPPVKRSEAEIEREKKVSAAWKTVEELSAVAYQMRSEFVDGLQVTKKNIGAMLKGAVSSIIPRCVDYDSADRTLMYSILGLDDKYESDKGVKAMMAFDKLSDSDYPKLIYSNFNDSKDKRFTNTYKNSWPEYKRNASLDALYGWLCGLGYEMSADEKAMQDGSHEIFIDVDKIKDGNDE